MKTRFMFKALSIMFVLILVIGCSKVPKFDHYGVFIKEKNSFKEIDGFEWSDVNGIYQNSRNYDKTPIVFENELEIYVYSAKAKIINYKLIIPNNKNRNDDFYFNYLEAEITVEPVEKRDDLVIIRSTNYGGTFILHNEDESKGFIFNSQNNIVNDEIKQTISNWITLLNNSKFTEFIELYHNPSKIENMKKDETFMNTIKELKKYKKDLISELETMLNENPTYFQDYVFFNSSSSTFVKENDKWYKVYDLKECYEKVTANRQAVFGDLNNLASSALAFYKTPTTHGGGGRSWSSNVDNVGQWVGYDYNVSTNNLSTKNGSFNLSINQDILTIVGTGNEIGNDDASNVKGTITIKGATSSISAKVNN